MAAKKGKKKQATGKSGSPAMDFIVQSLKSRPSSTYGEIAEAASKKGIKIYPVMYGRAQTLVGLVKAKPRGSGAAAVKKAAAAAAGGARRGRPPLNRPAPTGRRGGFSGDAAAFLKNYEMLREEHQALRTALELVQREIARALR